MAPDPSGHLDALGAALRAEADRYRAGVQTGTIRAAEAAHRRGRRRLAAGVALLVIVFVTAGGLTVAGSRPPATAAATLRPAPAAAAPAAGRLGTARFGPVSLADCSIAPANSSLAFAGWATTDTLHVTGGSIGPGRPVYALVTRGLAEWVGWQGTSPGRMFPPPVGRMGCIYDPATGATSLVGVPMDWQPPQLVDGCPASAIHSYGGYREIGGPNAWLLLPPKGGSWSKGGGGYRVLVRLARPPDGEVTAWSVPLGRGDEIPAAVTQPARASGARGAMSSATYLSIDFRIPRPGCWVLDVSAGGQLAGSAVVGIQPVRTGVAGAPISIP